MWGTRDVSLSPVDPPAFVTLADAKAFLGVSGSLEDARITSLIGTAGAMIEAYCGTVLAARTVTEIVDTEDVHSVLVLRHSANSLTSVSRDGVAETVGDYRLSKAVGTIRREDKTPLPCAKWTIVYTSGYATLPPPLIEAALQLVRALYNTKGTPVGVKSEDVDDVGSVTFGENGIRGVHGVTLPVEVVNPLAPYIVTFTP